ncbi:MAG: ABC transporter permease, partial [Planctomycetales bacterium]|nr:ABC transporter permease [Planctomycetales bacterium]
MTTAATGTHGWSTSWSIAWTFALRELRGGIKGFRIFLACLALGVAAIAGAGSLNYAVKAGIDGDAQRLLGGDLQARLSYRPASDEEIVAMAAGGATVNYQVQLRSMARVEGSDGIVKDRTLIELKAVDGAYPLYGAVEMAATTLGSDAPLSAYFEQRSGRWGALIDPSLLSRLNIQLGDQIRVGEAAFEVRGTIAHEPDRVLTFATAGPRVMISTAALPDTQLIQVGSLLTHIYNMRTDPNAPGGETTAQLDKRLRETFPDAGWRIRGLGSAAAGLEGFLDNVTLFLTLVGMTALLTGGIGVANAVRAHMNGRITTIATLKCLGAPADV